MIMSEIPTDQPATARETEVPELVALNHYLQHHAPQLGNILEIRQFPSGYSNLTFCLTTNKGEYILRRPPIGANIKSAHDMGREFTVISKLKEHYEKVPEPVLHCEDEEIIGAPFYIMERMHGVILRATNARKLHLPPALFRKISEALIDNLVELHSLDIYITGLDRLGKPEGYVQRQVEGWTKRYYQAETDNLENMNTLSGWLAINIPDQQVACFLHNDYKYDNVILDPNNLTKIVGVLDWEMATVGDPLMDLGACLAYWSEAGDDPVLQSFNLTALPGNLTRQEVATRYAERSKRDLFNIIFYYVFGLFKNAVIAQQIYSRWKQGFSKDPRFGGLITVIKSLAKLGVESLDKQRL
jgi:aminoglycoside phosphotransferase (APT) family kinase protein